MQVECIFYIATDGLLLRIKENILLYGVLIKGANQLHLEDGLFVHQWCLPY